MRNQKPMQQKSQYARIRQNNADKIRKTRNTRQGRQEIQDKVDKTRNTR